MSKKLKKTITPKKKGKIKNNNLGNNNFEDGNPGRIDDLLDIEYHGMTLGDYLDKEYPLYGDPSMDTEQLLTLRRAQYHGIVVACKMDPRGAGEWELLVNGRLRQIQDEIEYLEEIITIKKDIVDTFD